MSAERKQEEQLPASLPYATPPEDISLEDHDEDLELKRKKRKKEMDKAKYQRMLATQNFLKAKNPRYSKVDIRGEAKIRGLFDSWEQSLQQEQVGQQQEEETWRINCLCRKAP